MYMKGIPLAPSYKNIHNRLAVKYWINLVLLDDEERRYFKQTEVIIYRKPWFIYINIHLFIKIHSNGQISRVVNNHSFHFLSYYIDFSTSISLEKSNYFSFNIDFTLISKAYSSVDNFVRISLRIWLSFFNLSFYSLRFSTISDIDSSWFFLTVSNFVLSSLICK